MITGVSFHRFKQFRDQTFALNPGVSLLGGGNNSGKSTILHGLAVWEFCRTALEMERGADLFLGGYTGQGIGLGDDEFSPINVPSLKHLWTNLKTQEDTESDGYTLNGPLQSAVDAFRGRRPRGSRLRVRVRTVTPAGGCVVPVRDVLAARG